MALYGQDIGQVRNLAKQLNAKAGDIQSIISQLSSAVNSVEWRGPDAERFKSDWSNTFVPQLKKVIAGLQDAAKAASANADQQEAASR